MNDSSSVRQVVPVASTTVAQSTLARVDYADSFLVGVGAPSRRTAEDWARAVLEEAPVALRGFLLSGWSTLGLKLKVGGGRDSILGWPIRSRSDASVLLGAGSRTGLPAELLFYRRGRQLGFATFVQFDGPLARARWTAIEPTHVRVVAHLLGRVGGDRRVRRGSG